MDNSPLVSVIVPVYNVRPYLAEALDSVVNQTYKNLEILVIDDGSTDGSGELCDEYAAKDSRMHVVHQQNGGISAARNRGLDLMTGDVVAFLDSDDAFDPCFVEQTLSALLREKTDLVECKYTVHRTVGALGKTNRKKSLPLIKAGMYDRISALSAFVDAFLSPCVWNKLYLRELWSGIRFPEGRVYEDNEVILYVIDSCHSCYVINQTLYFYRKRPGSITNTVSQNCVRSWSVSCSVINEYILENTPSIFNEKQLARRLHSQLEGLISAYCRLDRKNEANKSFDEDLRNQIIQFGKENKAAIYGIRTTAAYYMARFCPRLLLFLYPIYHVLRLFTFFVAGR